MRTSLRLATTSALNIAYEQTGPEFGEAIVLLHGFPYDIRQYDDVRDLLSDEGHRLIVPYLRGFGPTHYRSKKILRSGQQAALGNDVIELLEAVKIERAVLVGYDWGSRAACVAAALWPERIRALVSVGGYTIQDIAVSAMTPASAEQEQRFWYQWYFNTERGRRGLSAHRAQICRLLWRLWSPSWHFAESLFASTAKSFDNPDFVSTVIHSYRHRYANGAGDPSLARLEKRLARRPKISAPTICLHGADDGVDPPESSEGQELVFTSEFERRVLPHVGHCLPKEAPEAVCQAIRDVIAWPTKRYMNRIRKQKNARMRLRRQFEMKRFGRG